MRRDANEILGAVSGGRVLDVATGGGRFIVYLREHLGDYEEFVGIDTDESAATRFAERFEGAPNIRFEVMDALELRFPGASFDTVAIGNSLCEFKAPSRLLKEMLHVLRPGGRLLVAEGYRDRASEPMLTHVLFHDWWVSVESLEGGDHQRFRRRRDLVRSLQRLGLSELQLVDVPDDADPRDPTTLAEIDELTDRYIDRAAGDAAIQARGEELRRRMHDVGFLAGMTLVAVGRKPA